MNIYQDKLIESIEMMIEEKISSIPFNYEIIGKIIEELSIGRYSIEHNGEVINANAISSHEYSPGDIVHILVLNNDFSNKIILGKKVI